MMCAIPSVEVDHYHDYKELKGVLEALAAAAPDLCRLKSIGVTHEGRDILMLEITDYTSGVTEEKTGYYAEACTHGEEFCGTNMALEAAWELLDSFGRKEDITQLLKETVFYIIPRLNPDGVEAVIKTGMPGVTNGKYPLEERQTLPGLYPWDINGDNIVAQMRIPDPDGEWKVSEKDPRLMALRKPYENGGRYYRMYPEGLIRGDTAGFEVPMPMDVNLNRNYPVNWQPEELQYGACELPLSEPETRAVAEFMVAHPNIAGVISFHTNAGAIMRPFGGKGDECFKGADLAMYEALGAMGTEDLGYEVMSTYGGFTPDKSRIRGGTLSDWTFEILGIPSIMLELWNVYDAAGTSRPKNFHFSAKDEEKELEILKWADREIGPSAYLDWQPVDHPQLGRVEVGGWNRLRVERNPPESYLKDLAKRSASFTIKLAKTLPRLRVRETMVTCLGENLYKISAVIRNSGYLPTYLTTQAIESGKAQPVRVELEGENGSFKVECCSHGDSIGHLEGRFGRDAEWSHDRAMWRPVERRVQWMVRTKGENTELTLRAWGPRCGTVRQKILL